MNRRQFLHASAVTSALTIVPPHVLGAQVESKQVPPSEKLNIAGVGVGGQGGGVLRDLYGTEEQRSSAATPTVNIVALADVDWQRCAGTFRSYKDAQKFKDYRQLLDKAHKSFDAVMVATPDHMHAPIAMAAMRLGKHVYVEKPMAHTIEEARLMTGFARENKLVTQMGNNGHAGEGLRLTKEWLDAGAIGVVKEVHCWSDRPGTFWKQDKDVPSATPPVPTDMDWYLWLGCAADRPYHPDYAPRTWRGWFDFGTGALGDMAVHNLDPAFYCLDLDAPIAAEAQTSGVKSASYPAWQVITCEFAAKGNRPAVNTTWYDGGKMPQTPSDVQGEFNLPDNGILFIGDRGTMVCGGWSGAPRLFPASRRKDFQLPEKTIPRSIGHRQEWIQACKDGRPRDAKAGFDYSGPFTEALLVGNLAVRLQKRVEWDSRNLKCPNAPEAEPLIRKSYRPGFSIHA